ncbi:MAG: ribonuclease [Ruminococcaceae bacterium]|nr:ribonuclease [Oscillospiraceae bacterium]
MVEESFYVPSERVSETNVTLPTIAPESTESQAVTPPSTAPPTTTTTTTTTAAPTTTTTTTTTTTAATTTAPAIDINGTYTTKDDVALYIHTYGKLPSNFITKSEARNLGWPGGGLDDYAYGKCIGGDRFGNYERILPTASGRFYTECDINTLHARSRGAERIVFSNDGLIFYTNDHYESFTQLY